MSAGQRFFVAKTYVTESGDARGYSEWGWHVFVIDSDGAVLQLDDFYTSEDEALADAVACIRGWRKSA